MTASVISFFLIPHYPYFRYFIGHPSLTRTVPKTGQKNTSPRDNLYPMGSFRFPCSGNTRLSVVFRCPRPSIFVKFTWHANPHYRYL